MDDAEKFLKIYELFEKSASDDKKIQITMLTFSITAASTIITLIYTGVLLSDSDGPFKQLIPLLPLLFLWPCWVFYYDSAITIVRKMAYCRIVERFIFNPTIGKSFVGYETGIKHFNIQEEKYLDTHTFEKRRIHIGKVSWHKVNIFGFHICLPNLRKKIRAICKSVWGIIFLCNHHRNWSIVFYTYLISTITCLAASYKTITITNNETYFVFIVKCYDQFVKNVIFQFNLEIHFIWIMAFFITVFLTVRSFLMLYELNYTKHSYDTKEKVWEIVFEMDKK